MAPQDSQRPPGQPRPPGTSVPSCSRSRTRIPGRELTSAGKKSQQPASPAGLLVPQRDAPHPGAGVLQGAGVPRLGQHKASVP